MNSLSSYKKALFIAAHPDDTELNAGGLLQVLLQQNCQVHHLCVSNPVISMPAGFPEDTFIREMGHSFDLLGVKQENRMFLDIPGRNFPQHRQDILEEFVKVRKELTPDLVICHSPKDIHQDHKTVGEEVMRAFRTATILTYTHPWNAREMAYNFFVEVDEKIIKNKAVALGCYKSQATRNYVSQDKLNALALTMGMMAGVDLAEGFYLETATIKYA